MYGVMDAWGGWVRTRRNALVEFDDVGSAKNLQHYICMQRLDSAALQQKTSRRVS